MTNRRTKDVLEEIHDLAIDKQHRLIYVHSEFDAESESGVDWRMASRFVKNLDYLASLNSDPITIKLLTPGGEWNEGMAMFDAIQQCHCEVTTVSFAHARSMSSIIIQAADRRLLHRHTDFMVHYGTYSDEGDFRAVSNGMKYYERSNDVMLAIYAGRCAKGRFARDNKMKVPAVKAFIKKMIDEKTDWWMSAEEAVYYGFVDAVI